LRRGQGSAGSVPRPIRGSPVWYGSSVIRCWIRSANIQVSQTLERVKSQRHAVN